jgi:hypothetical protein
MGEGKRGEGYENKLNCAFPYELLSNTNARYRTRAFFSGVETILRFKYGGVLKPAEMEQEGYKKKGGFGPGLPAAIGLRQ